MHESGLCAWQLRDAERFERSRALGSHCRPAARNRSRRAMSGIERLRAPRIAAAAVEHAFM
jgi:hypothetical protein